MALHLVECLREERSQHLGAMMKPPISVLVATRRRAPLLARLAMSLVDNADDARSFELVLAFDSDDTETLDQWAKCDAARRVQWRSLVGPRMGYANLHVYYNALAEIARGDWLLLLGDDTFVTTDGWDDRIRSKSCDRIYNTGNPNDPDYSRVSLMHPVVPRAWYVAAGRLSAYSQFDTYLHAVGHAVGRIDMGWLFEVGHVMEGAGPSDRIRDEVTAAIVYSNDLPIEEARRDAAAIAALYVGDGQC
jgi:hypothetical protein